MGRSSIFAAGACDSGRIPTLRFTAPLSAPTGPFDPRERSSPMQMTLLALGTRGDVQPMIALGRGLVAAGHRVRLATHESFAPLAAAHGLELRALASDPARIMQ